MHTPFSIYQCYQIFACLLRDYRITHFYCQPLSNMISDFLYSVCCKSILKTNPLSIEILKSDRLSLFYLIAKHHTSHLHKIDFIRTLLFANIFVLHSIKKYIALNKTEQIRKIITSDENLPSVNIPQMNFTTALPAIVAPKNTKFCLKYSIHEIP